MLAECKANCDELVVGLQVDPSVDRPQKSKPIQSLYERFIQLESIKYVDRIVVYESESELVNVLLSLMPNRRFVSEEYKDKNFTGSNLEGIEVFYNQRKHKYSSSQLRERCRGE